MKGFFSILYLIFVIAIVFSIFTYYQNLFSLNKRNEMDFIKFETYSNRETDLKNFIIDTIKHELENVKADETSDEIVERIGEKLSKLENYENWYKNFNFDVDFWCGYITPSEQKSLSREMIDQKMAIKCRDCKDFDDITLKERYEDGKIKTVYVRSCAKFLSYSQNSIEISEDDRVMWNGTKIGTPALGISIYDKSNGIASIVIFAEGTKIKKGWKN